MTTQINSEMRELDANAQAFLMGYIEAKAKVKEWSEKADIYAEQIKAQLGDAEIGLIGGKESVRWTSVTSERVDVTKLREKLGAELLQPFMTQSVSRRFTIVEA